MAPPPPPHLTPVVYKWRRETRAARQRDLEAFHHGRSCPSSQGAQAQEIEARGMHEGTSDMKQFLRQLGLKWPNPSASSRADLLRSMIRASLGVGLPLLWGFHVGRDPVLPARQNALYITLDKHVLTWMEDVLKLAQRGRLRLYLRRCAEVVGGAGQSYALMISDVAAIHKELATQVQADGSYFGVLCSAAAATVRFFIRSLRQPKSNVYHVAGVAPLLTYRLLVARELVVMDYFLRPPLTEEGHPPAVLAAVLGTTIAQQIFALLYILFFYNDRFEPVAPVDVDPELIAIKAELARYRLLLANRTSELGTLRVSEIRLLTTLSLAATAASHAASVLEARRSGAAWLGATTAHGGDATFAGVPRDKLFFLVNCFPSCGHSGRERIMQLAFCNVALPAAAAFRRAFQCDPTHSLWTNFTWREF